MMKNKITFIILAIIMLSTLLGCAVSSAQGESELEIISKRSIEQKVSYDGFVPEKDYLTIMKECCLNGNIAAGKEAEVARNKKIDALQIPAKKMSFDDLYLLSKIITKEAGSSWLSMEWKMMVGEVVLNRIASVEFPNTMQEVIYQKGQYSNVRGNYFKNLKPFNDCVSVAAELLSGKRILKDPSVVFQSQSKQGSGVHTKLYDKYYGYTYFCYSNYPHLYKE